MVEEQPKKRQAYVDVVNGAGQNVMGLATEDEPGYAPLAIIPEGVDPKEEAKRLNRERFGLDEKEAYKIVVSSLRAQKKDDVLRMYPHFGKYEGELLLSVPVHRLAGMGEDITDGAGNVVMFPGTFGPEDFEEMNEVLREEGHAPLTETEKLYLLNHWFMVHESDQGFVSITAYGSEDVYNQARERMEDEWEGAGEEE